MSATRFVETRDTPQGRVEVVYGVDVAGVLGIFGSVTRPRAVWAEYHALQSEYDGLPGLLRLFVGAGVVTEDDVRMAERELPHVEDASEIADDAVRFVAEVVTRVRRLAGA